jgi:hypothetical protein
VAVGVEEQQGELVAAEADDEVVGPDVAPHAVADRHQQLVAGGVAQRVVHRLEVVQVDQHHRHRLAAGQRLLQPFAEQSAVAQAGDRVVEGVVAEPGLLGVQSGEGLLEAVVAQHGGRLVGQGVEQLGVVGAGAGGAVGRIAHDQEADDAVLGHQAGGHGVGRHVPIGQVGGQHLGDRAALGQGGQAGGGLAGHRRQVSPLLAPLGQAQDAPLGPAGEEDELGGVAVKGGQQMVEQAGQAVLHRPGGHQVAGGPVEELHLAGPVVLGHVGAVRDEHDADRDDQQQEGQRVVPGHEDGQHGQARVRRADAEAGAEHVAEPVGRRPFAHRGHGRHDERHRDRGGDDHRGQGGRPVGRRERRSGRTAVNGVEDEQCQAGAQGVLGEVEGAPHSRHLPLDGQRDPRSHHVGGHQQQRRQEEQAQHEGQLGEGQRVGVGPGRDVDEEALGGQEAQGQRPDRQPAGTAGASEAADRGQQEGSGDGDSRDEEVDRPDPVGRRLSPAATAPPAGCRPEATGPGEDHGPKGGSSAARGEGDRRHSQDR